MQAICQQLSAYLDGALSAGERVRFESHLAGCPRCTAESARQAELDRLLTAARARPEPVPDSLQQRVAEILETPARAPRPIPAWLRWSPLAAAAAVLLVVGWGWLQRATGPTVPVQTAGQPPEEMEGAAPATRIQHSQAALARLALLATAARAPAGRPQLAYLSTPEFPAPMAHVPAPSRLASPEPASDEEPDAQIGEEPAKQHVVVPPFNACSMQSGQTLGERKFGRIIPRPVVRDRKLEDIPC